MQRLTLRFAVAFLTFGVGVLLWSANPLRWLKPLSEPLRLTVSERIAANSNILFDHYAVTIENVSSKTVQGYSVGRTCDCRGQGTYGPYPEGINFSNPNPGRQRLEPGESQTQIVPGNNQLNDQVKVWVDLVHFKDGTNWGPNESRTEGYVRALE